MTFTFDVKYLLENADRIYKKFNSKNLNEAYQKLCSEVRRPLPTFLNREHEAFVGAIKSAFEEWCLNNEFFKSLHFFSEKYQKERSVNWKIQYEVLRFIWLESMEAKEIDELESFARRLNRITAERSHLLEFLIENHKEEFCRKEKELNPIFQIEKWAFIKVPRQ